MTTVLPAWKKELIERKKKKDLEEKQKLQEQTARIEQIPEWKRNLIQKRSAQTGCGSSAQRASNFQNVSNGNTAPYSKPLSSSSSFPHSKGRNYVIEHASSTEKPRVNKSSSDVAQGKVSPIENIDNEEKNSLVTRAAPSYKLDNVSGVKEKTVALNALNSEEDLTNLKKSEFSKPIDNVVNGLDHEDVKMESEPKNISDNVEYEHVRPPSVIRKMFEKPKIQIISGNDKSEETNKKITGYSEGKSNRVTDNFKSGNVDRPATEIDQIRVKSPSYNEKLIEQKLPNSFRPSFENSKQSESDKIPSANNLKKDLETDGFSDSDSCQISEKSRNVSNTKTNTTVVVSGKNTSAQSYPIPFAPKPYTSFNSSSKLPWRNSNFEVAKSKDVSIQSLENKITSGQTSGNIDKVKTEEITQDFHKIQTPQPVQNIENEKQDSTSAVDTQLSSPTIFSGSSGTTQKYVIKSRTENVGSSISSTPHVEEKSENTSELHDHPSSGLKINHENCLSAQTTLLHPTKDSGKSQEISRPPPPKKRWSADVATMISLQKSNKGMRHRSPSLNEIPEEQLDWCQLFKHRPSISEGIERRMSKLKRQASHSEDEEGEEMSPIHSTPTEVNEKKSDETKQKNTKARPASWAAPDDFVFGADETPNNNYSNQVPIARHPSDVNVPFAHRPSVGESIEHRVGQLVRHSSTPDMLASVSDSENEVLNLTKQSHDDEKETDIDRSKELEDAPSNKVTAGDNINEEKSVEENAKPSKGSVHKLSALFGSSIFKSNKKDKLKAEPKTAIKNSQKNVKSEKEKSKNLTRSKEEGKASPSLFKKVFKNENKNAKDVNSLKENKKDLQTCSMEKKDNSKAGSTNDNVEHFSEKSWSTNELHPVARHEKRKVEKKIGMMVIMIDEDAEEKKPNYKRSKTITQARIVDFEKSEVTSSETAHQTSQIQNLSKSTATKADLLSINGIVDLTHNLSDSHKSTGHSLSVDSTESTMSDISISVIDMPEQSKSDVEVSVIDVPRSPTSPEVEVSAIDLPESPEAPEISVIDMPETEELRVQPLHQTQVFDISDESDDSDSDDEMSGSYDITAIVDGEDGEPFVITEGQKFGKEDEDDVLVSNVDVEPTKYKVPVVIFDVAPPSNLKPCMCPKTGRKKPISNRKISFQDNHTLHHYLSEESMAAEFDEMERRKANESKMTLSSYQPTLSKTYKQNGDESRRQGVVQQSQKGKQTLLESKSVVDKTETENSVEAKTVEITNITYQDEGYGFTDLSDNSGALLF